MSVDFKVNKLNIKIAELEKENALLKRKLGISELAGEKEEFADGNYKTGILSDENLRYHDVIFNKGENWFKSIFENTISGIVFKNISGEVFIINHAFENLIGYTLEEIKGKNIESFTFTEDCNLEYSILQKAISGNKDFYRFEKRYVHKNQYLVWVDVSVSIIRDSENNPAFLVSVINDVTEKKEHEYKLLQALEYNEKINQTSPVGIVQCDKDGAIVFANKKAEDVLGLEKQNITQLAYNSPEWEITDFEGNTFSSENLPFALVKEKSASVYNIQHAIRWPNGKIVFLSINASPQFDLNGSFNGMIATVDDITDEIKAERELNENLQFRNSIIRNAAEGLCVCCNCDEFPYLKFTIWNEQMIKITGYNIDEINQYGWYQSLYPDMEIQNDAIGRMQKMRKGTDIVGEQLMIRTKDGEDKITSISASIIKSEIDRTFVMALITDVTEKEKYRLTIEQQNKTLQELNATKNKFFSVISHDLRGPVGQLYSVSELLYKERKELDEKEIDFFLKSILESADKALKLLGDLLTWSKSQMNKIELIPQLFKTCDLFSDTVYMLNDTLKAKEIEVDIVDNELSVLADLNSIRTVLRNLLFNAIKFSYRGSRVKMESIRNSEKEVTISIADYGVGIPPDKIETLFQIDKLCSTSGTENEMGTGLGLSICKEFVGKNQGKIWLESEVGKGSTFFFSLPC